MTTINEMAPINAPQVPKKNKQRSPKMVSVEVVQAQTNQESKEIVDELVEKLLNQVKLELSDEEFQVTYQEQKTPVVIDVINDDNNSFTDETFVEAETEWVNVNSEPENMAETTKESENLVETTTVEPMEIVQEKEEIHSTEEPLEILESDCKLVSKRISVKYNLSQPRSRLSMGPSITTSEITTSVFRTNPILDQVLIGLHSIIENDPETIEFNVKDFQLSNAQAMALCEALSTNTHLKKLHLSNASIQNNAVIQLGKSLAQNQTLEIIDLQGNQIGPQGMRELGYALKTNTSVKELLLGNQKSITSTGLDAEHAFAESMEKNQTLIKLGLSFSSFACRDRVDRAITRNKELARKLRLKK